MHESLPIIVSIAGLLLVAAGLLQATLIHKRSTDAQMFLEFTSRFAGLTSFQEILDHDDLVKSYQHSPKNNAIACSYFDLICHEYHLNKEKILSNKIWNLWQDDIKRVVRTRFMSEAWDQSAKTRYSHHTAFVHYIDKMTNKH